MTAQSFHDSNETSQPADVTDPIGPLTLPKRSRIGSRAFALVGAASVLAVGAMELVEYCPTYPPTTSVSAY